MVETTLAPTSSLVLLLDLALTPKIILLPLPGLDFVAHSHDDALAGSMVALTAHVLW